MTTQNEGEAVLHGGNLKGYGWIVLRAHDRDALAEYYKALGFEEYGRAHSIIGMHAGNGCILEIGHLDEGTPTNRQLRSRTEHHSMGIVGCEDSDRVVELARAAGSPLQELMEIRSTRLWYICDPEWNVMGFANGGPAWPGDSRTMLIERIEAARRG